MPGCGARAEMGVVIALPARTTGRDVHRAWACADWLVRTHAAEWLEAAGDGGAATRLRSLPELCDARTAATAMHVLDAVYAEDDPAWDGACAAAGDPAWDAAWATSW